MKPIRVVILGTSFGGLVQAPAFRAHPGFEVVALAGARLEHTREVAARVGVPRAHSDWREAIAKESPDLVSVVSPADLHHPMMLAALAAGAHVLCEKPTALHLGQAVEMRDAARAAGRIAGINHEFRFFPARMHALELVRRGDLGRVRRMDIVGRYPIWPRPESRGLTWLSQAERGGGILGAMGSHHTDCLRTFLGEPESVLASVRVDQPRRGEAIATADDACTLSYTFAGGVTAGVDLSASVPYRAERFEVHGEQATLRWDEGGQTLWRIEPGREPVVLETPEALRLRVVEGEPLLAAPFRVMVERLHRALAHGEPLEPEFGRDAVPVQAALDACRNSARAGTRVAVVRPS